MNYKEIIESRYNRQNWQLLLRDIFGSKIKFWSTPSIVAASSAFAKQALWLGTITLSDEQTIAVYEVELADSVDIERNRRGIRDMLLTTWRNNGNAGAFMFCYRKSESVLRFSYVSEAWKFAEDGSYQKETTDARRYTYLLGEGHRSRTAIQQFEKLRDSDLSLKDLTKAFSVDAVSDMFFDGYKKQYEDIIFYITGKRMVKVANKWEERLEGKPCQHIMQQFSRFPNPEKAIRDYVKKLMGRLVFLQFLQKKGWLGVGIHDEWGSGDSEFIQNLFARCNDKDHFIDKVLEPLFDDLNSENEKKLPQYRTPYLNGGLFEQEAADDTDFPLPEKYMKSLLDFFASYNFTIDENDPDDAEVGVDPEMLGRIFENLLEDNKDKGAFYTPKEIVSYMCRESLIAYLQTGIEDETTKEAIRQFVTTHEVQEHLPENTDQLLKDVKICDPAIGSGAFPMGLLKELFLCRTALEGISQHQAAEIKKHIIQQNVYGVDIERGAVDIARLRFWLSLIVDEETPQALPNLDFKIMQGNSLLEQYKGVDLSTMTEKKADNTGMLTFFDDMIDVYRKELRDMLIQYFDCTDHKEKQSLRTRIIDNVKQQLLEQHIKVDFGDLDLSGNEQFFLWHTWFHDVFSKGGFNIVIANPPYIGEKGHKEIFQPIKQEVSLKEFYIGKMDYFYFFFHLASNFLHDKGICTFITTNYYPTALGARKLRNDFARRTNILQLINFNEYKIFESALGQHNLITILEKSDLHNKKCKILNTSLKGFVCNGHIQSILDGSDKSVSVSRISQQLLFEGDEKYIRLYSENEGDNKLTAIFDKMMLGNKKLGDVANVNTGLFTACDKVFIDELDSIRHKFNTNKLEQSLLKPLYKNSDIHKYATSNKAHKVVIYHHEKATYSITEIPNIYAYLFEHKSKLQQRRDNSLKGALKRGRWDVMALPKTAIDFDGPKIVAPQRSKSNTFGYNEIPWYASADVYFITKPTDGYLLKYILGLLNSKLYYTWLYYKGKRKGDCLELYQKPLSEIPIIKASLQQQESIVAIIDHIISVKKTDILADTATLESEIDRLVYQLYGLSYDEVLIVDPNTPITKEEYEANNRRRKQ
jgi:hypothetical protein